MARGSKRRIYKRHGVRKYKRLSGNRNWKSGKRKKQYGAPHSEQNTDNSEKRVKIYIEERESVSESETEESAYSQLLSAFTSTGKSDRNKAVDSDEERDGEESDEKVEDEDSDIENNVQDLELADGKEDNIDSKRRKFVASAQTSRNTVPPELECVTRDDEVESPIEDEENDETLEEKMSMESSNDPFSLHYEGDLPASLLDTLSSSSPWHTTEIHWPHLGRMLVQLPDEKPTKEEHAKENTVLLQEETKLIKAGELPVLRRESKWQDFYVKLSISKNIDECMRGNAEKTEHSHPLTSLQRELFSIISMYQDVYYPQRTFSNGEELRFIYSLHVVNHIRKSLSKIMRNNRRIRQQRGTGEYRDQGLNRPKVLIVLPFKQAAFRVVMKIIDIALPKEKRDIPNMERFEDEYCLEETLPLNMKRTEDYYRTFSGNTEEFFRIGLSISKNYVKLYANFYEADVILTSPLGIRTLIGAEGDRDREFDFLSSIEILILDQADIFMMQNWDHVLQLMSHLHLQPLKSHGVDFSRVRMWALNGWTKYYRQTLMFSSVPSAELGHLFNKLCYNFSGKVKIMNPILSGSICQIVVQLPQVFHQFEATSASESCDARFNFFMSKILPQYQDSLMTHTLIFIPSYFDFVRMRNRFKKDDISYVQLCEYTKFGKLGDGRRMFFIGEKHFMLFTERLHFYRRPVLKGIRHLIFYELPLYPHFYSDMCNLMQEANQNVKQGSHLSLSCTVLYSRYDAQRLSGVVGTERAKLMINSEKNVHMFVTGDL